MNDSGSFLRAWRVQVRCIEALATRDMMARYGRGNLGFLWVLVEPMILTLGVLMLWSAIKGDREHGVQVAALVITGYLPLTVWRHMTNSGIFLLRRNVGLLFHRHVTTLDCFIARMAIEFLAITAGMLLISTSLVAMRLIDPIADYGLLFVGWFAMGCLSASTALIIAGLTELSEVWERFIAPFQYILLPLSGCFFMVHWLPTSVQKIALMLPIVHCFEIFRAGYFGTATPTHFDIWYPFLSSLFLGLLGLALFDRARNSLHPG